MRCARRINELYKVRAYKDKRDANLFQTIHRSQNLMLLFLLTTSFGFSGCLKDFLLSVPQSLGQPVTVEPLDSTPPTVELRIPDLSTTVHSGDQPRTFHVNDIKSVGLFFAMGFAQDPQGVKSISVLSEYTQDCTFNGEGYTESGSNVSDGPGAAFSSQATIGQTATTTLWVPLLVDTSAIQCPSRAPDGTRTLTVWATATNFSNQKMETGVVNFIWP